MPADISTTNRVGIGTNSSAGRNPSLASHSSKTGTPRDMPDGARQPERNPNTDQWGPDSRPSGVADSNSAMSQRPPPGFSGAPGSNKPGPPGLSRDHHSSSAYSSPPASHSSAIDAFAQAPILAAPRPMPPYPRLTSPQLGEQHAGSTAARSPSPSKRFNFPMGDLSERWNSIGQATHQSQQQAQNQGPPRAGMPRKQSTQSSGGSTGAGANQVFASEPFLGYNELFSPTSAHGSDSKSGERSMPPPTSGSLSTSDPMNPTLGATGSEPRALSLPSQQDADHFPQRFDMSGSPFPDQYGFAGPNGAGLRGMDDFPGCLPFSMGQGMPPLPCGGNLSPRSLLHYHHQQLQAQQAMAMQAVQQGLQSAPGAPGQQPMEEITTVFIVGFPDDMTEREFANIFLFAKGFEASTLKIPLGSGSAGPGGRTSESSGNMIGPGGPYQAVNMPGAGLFDLPNGPGGAWDEHGLSLALSRAGASDTFSSLANMGGMSNALAGIGGPNAQSVNLNLAGGKIKQIIGFAKFRTRAEAIEARDALNGRKIDAEKGCVLKTEMAKKNLHTKQRPILSGTGGSEGNLSFGPPPPGGPGQQQPPFGMGHFDRDGMPFNHPRDAQNLPQAGPPSAGPFGSFPPGKPPSNFEPFSQSGSSGPGRVNGIMSPHEAFNPDFYGPGSGPSQAPGLFNGPKGLGGGPPSEQQGRGPATGDAWANSMGPLDYFGPESGPQGPRQSGAVPGSGGDSQQQIQSQPVARPDWGSVGSPPGLYGMNAGPASNGARPAFLRQTSRGPLSGTTSESGHATGGSGSNQPGSKPEDFGKGESTAGNRTSSSPQQAGFENVEQGATQQSQQQAGSTNVASRFNSFKLGSPKGEGDGSTNTGAQGRGTTQIPSPDLPSPTGRGFVGDNHPPNNTLFVGNLPSSASSTVIFQIEDQLRSLFASCRGFRQFSFRLKSNGPMCFVEFDDVHTASNAMSEQNGNTLGGAIKNGGIRLSFSKNPLFRMNSNSAMNSSGGTMSLGHAGESLFSTKAEIDLDLVNNLEESAYKEGFQQGHEHGALHGTFEGREYGREKGFEVWEEVGFYEGMAKTWRSLVDGQTTRKGLKQLQHLEALEKLIAAFPTTNKSDAQEPQQIQGEEDISNLDMLALLERIRARYKLTCSVLGVRPRNVPDSSNNQADSKSILVNGKMIDPTQLRY